MTESMTESATQPTAGRPNLQELMDLTQDAADQLRYEREIWLADPQEDEASYLDYIMTMNDPRHFAYLIGKHRKRASAAIQESDTQTARAYLTMLALQIPNVSQLHRRLAENPEIREASGIGKLPGSQTIRNALRLMGRDIPRLKHQLHESLGVQQYDQVTPGPGEMLPMAVQTHRDQDLAIQAAYTIIQYAQENLYNGKPPVPQHREILQELAGRIFPAQQNHSAPQPRSPQPKDRQEQLCQQS